jgi:hypothetical protein
VHLSNSNSQHEEFLKTFVGGKRKSAHQPNEPKKRFSLTDRTGLSYTPARRKIKALYKFFAVSFS